MLWSLLMVIICISLFHNKIMLLFSLCCFATCTVVQWLQSASITLLPDNKAVFVSCSVTESSPPVECLVVMNCSTCKEDTPKIRVPFTNHTTLMVLPETTYYISVQVIRTDVFETLDDYTFVKSVIVPKSTSDIGTSCKLITMNLHVLSSIQNDTFNIMYYVCSLVTLKLNEKIYFLITQLCRLVMAL